SPRRPYVAKVASGTAVQEVSPFEAVNGHSRQPGHRQKPAGDLDRDGGSRQHAAEKRAGERNRRQPNPAPPTTRLKLHLVSPLPGRRQTVSEPKLALPTRVRAVNEIPIPRELLTTMRTTTQRRCSSPVALLYSAVLSDPASTREKAD